MGALDTANANGLIAFGHQGLIYQAVAALCADIMEMRLDASWFPVPLRIPELQSFYEAVLAESLDHAAFLRDLETRQTLRICAWPSPK